MQVQYSAVSPPKLAVAVSYGLGVKVDFKKAKGSAATAAPVLATSDGSFVAGDAAIAKAICRRAGDVGQAFLGQAGTPSAADGVDYWLVLADVVPSLSSATETVAALEATLCKRTYLAGYSLTLADAAMAQALRSRSDASLPEATARWAIMCEDRFSLAKVEQSFPAGGEAMAAAGKSKGKGKAAASGAGAGQAGKGKGKGGGGAAAAAGGKGKGKGKGAAQGGAKGKGKGKGGGKSISGLTGAEEGKVCTRFPPEPSGYLHIGHLKALLLNEHFARSYGGKLLIRFDDTNPSKERGEFAEAILEDIGRLDIRPDAVSHTSDHFALIEECARRMIREGKAYMDDAPQDVMKIERRNGIESVHRQASAEENMEKFDLMLSGGGPQWCLRAKMDMRDPNKACRDPVLYRANDEPHIRFGSTYKAYPTYDFACPIVDSHEGVTHALRTTEYRDRDKQYHWMIKALGMRHVHIQEFSRLNFQFTLMSKRKLTQFVAQKQVEGWNDPRFPTVRGMLRRGVQVKALKDFMVMQGGSRRDVDMEWDVFWNANKKVVDPQAHRFFAIVAEGAVPVRLSNGPEGVEVGRVQLHPKHPEYGHKAMPRTKTVLIEAEDAVTIQEGEEITLQRWSNAIIRKKNLRADGSIESIDAELNRAGDFTATKNRICWVASGPGAQPTPIEAVEYDFLITKSKLEEGDNVDEFLNPVTMAVTPMLGEAALAGAKEDQVLQLERRAYYRVDRPLVDERRPLRLVLVPDGKTKKTSALSSAITRRDVAKQRDAQAAKGGAGDRAPKKCKKGAGK